MKIGVMTVHDSANFGSFLQAYALKTALEELGHEVWFIRTRKKVTTFRVFLNQEKNLKKLAYNVTKYKKFMKELEANDCKEIELNSIKEDTLDVLVIGSDELWNVNTGTFQKECFYGIDIPVKKKITYAISCGNATERRLSQYPTLINGMKDMDKIFIRDNLTKENLKSLIGRDCEFTCDPTFLVDIKKMKKDYDNPVKEKYVLIYSYRFTQQQKNFIRKFAAEHNYKIVSAGLYNDWCDINVNCTSLEFSQLICDAEYVFTTTFHGTIFSILNGANFVSLEPGPKVVDVLERTGLDHRIVHNSEDYAKFEIKVLTKIDFTDAYKRIKDMRKASLELLANELK